MFYVLFNNHQTSQVVQHLAVPIAQKARKFHFTKSLEKCETGPLPAGNGF